MSTFDVIVIGGGAAGLMAAAEAAKRHKRVLVLERAARLAGKVRISGGGRCNFTNRGARPSCYVSEQPRFCQSALNRFPAQAFIDRVEAYQIPYFEKKLGQLFCTRTSQDIIELLVKELGPQVTVATKQDIRRVSRSADVFDVLTQDKTYCAPSLVLATGGLSIPQMGASDLGYRVAQEFGLRVTPLAPALDGFVMPTPLWKSYAALSGISAPVRVRCRDPKTQTPMGPAFEENILFTHQGLSGPAALQASLYFQPGALLEINFFPQHDPQGLRKVLAQLPRAHPQQQAQTWLSQHVSERLARELLGAKADQPWSQWRSPDLDELCAQLARFELRPQGTVGYRKAEVTRGGIATQELNPHTMEARSVSGLYVVGELVDVTGWLGGYNFQWAWASGYVAGQAVGDA